jgi:Domain of unknown function (DUF4129)
VARLIRLRAHTQQWQTALRRGLLLLCLACLALLHPTGAAAQEPEPQQFDEDSVSIRNFSRTAIDSIRKLKDFDYTIKVERKKSWLQRVLEWLFDDVFTFSDKQGGTSTGRVIGWILIGLVIVFVILKLAGISPVALFRRSSRNIRYEITEDDIHGIEYKSAIAEAEARGEYRLAIRLHYLEMLRLLSDRALIDWQIGKTNDSYQRELRNTSHYEGFRQLTFIYEAAWYGELSVTRNLYERVRDLFTDFKKQIPA